MYAESLSKNVALRLAETEKIGTGLALPAPNAPKISVSNQSAITA
jgi:hypothetical protein